jgi:pyrroloquinoline quinone biosynthesis protein B
MPDPLSFPEQALPDARRGIAAEASRSGQPYALVLGTAQDAGFPQAGCAGACCAPAWADPLRRRHAACLAIVDPRVNKRWMIDATPDFKAQLRMLDETTWLNTQAGSVAESVAPPRSPEPAEPATISLLPRISPRPLDGIFLTHAHAGHYPGLIHLGPEAMGATGIPLHAMPRMTGFLENNLPWSDLVDGGTFSLQPLEDEFPVPLGPNLRIMPFLVPHRDERSETVAYRIDGPNHCLAYIPDIDGWEAWDDLGIPLPNGKEYEDIRPNGIIEDMLEAVDHVLVDGTFYAASELPGRDLSRIPHPFVVDTMKRLAPLPASMRGRLRFTHFNHSNPLLQPGSAERRAVIEAGFELAEEGQRFGL